LKIVCLSEDTHGTYISRPRGAFVKYKERGSTYVFVLSIIVSIAFRFIDFLALLSTLSSDLTVSVES
jgi:hypothetical protein